MQKKMWWCCGVSLAVSIVGINLAADHAARHPESLVGRCLVRVYNQNETMVRTVGKKYRSVREIQLMAIDAVDTMRSSSQMSPTSEVPTHSRVEDPKPIGTQTPAAPERLPGKIVIESTPETPAIIVQSIGEETQEFVPAPQNPEPAAGRMPYADELPLPAAGRRALPECREDPYRESQFPGCPATGGYPLPGVPRNYVPANGAMPRDIIDDPNQPWLPMQQNKGIRFQDSLELEKPSASDAKILKKYSWLQRIRKRLVDDTPPQREIDTTEFRPTDALPFGLGPNPY